MFDFDLESAAETLALAPYLPAYAGPVPLDDDGDRAATEHTDWVLSYCTYGSEACALSQSADGWQAASCVDCQTDIAYDDAEDKRSDGYWE